MSNPQLAAILLFLLALTLPIALFFMPSPDALDAVAFGYLLAGAGITVLLLVCPPPPRPAPGLSAAYGAPTLRSVTLVLYRTR